jgi:hypothetical protein
LLKETIKHALRRKAEAKDAKTKWHKKAMTIKIPKIACLKSDGTETSNHPAHSEYNHLVLDDHIFDHRFSSFQTLIYRLL